MEQGEFSSAYIGADPESAARRGTGREAGGCVAKVTSRPAADGGRRARKRAGWCGCCYRVGMRGAMLRMCRLTLWSVRAAVCGRVLGRTVYGMAIIMIATILKGIQPGGIAGKAVPPAGWLPCYTEAACQF
jgi:hypothetical protein